MKPEKPPAFQFYPKDYLSDENTVVMTLEETGAYIRLIGHCWLEGSIPADVARIAKMLKTAPRKMARLWPALAPCFVPTDGGRLLHPRLEKERAKQSAFREKKREAGVSAARKRWKKNGRDSTGIGDPSQTHSTPNATAIAKNASSSADKADALVAVPSSRGRVLGLTAAPEARVPFTATQIEQRRRDALRDLRGSA